MSSPSVTLPKHVWLRSRCAVASRLCTMKNCDPPTLAMIDIQSPCSAMNKNVPSDTGIAMSQVMKRRMPLVL